MGGINPAGSGGFWPPDQVIPAGTRVAGYRVEAEIGRGGMAVVLRAHDERLGRQVALKVMAPAVAADQAFRQRFVQESRAAAAVEDPHIIPIYEAGEAGGMLFIAMRYVGGGDVKALLRREGPLSPARALDIVSPVASALDAAHRRGLIHRDVKPMNMLLDVDPGRPDHVYLSDFGLSKRMLSTAGLTGTGQILGTFHYSAPEQVQGGQLDGRADQYALACTAFELLSGAPPFDYEEIAAVILAQMTEPPPALTSRRGGLASGVDQVLARALAKAAADRYATCRDFAEALRAALLPGPDDRQAGASQRAHPATATAWPATVARAQPAVPGPDHSGALPSQAVKVIKGGSAVLGFSPAGHLLTRELKKAVLCRWDPATGDQLDTTALQSGDGQFWCHQFSADGSVIASGGGDETIRLWTTDTGNHLRILKGRTGLVAAIALSPDNSLLASCTQDSPVVRLWDVAGGNSVHTFKNDSGVARSLAFSLDGRILAIGGSDHAVRLWDMTTGRHLRTLKSDKVRLRDRIRALSDSLIDDLPYGDDVEHDISAMVFSPDRQTLATCDDEGAVRLWALSTGRLQRTLNGADDGDFRGGRDYSPHRGRGTPAGRVGGRKVQPGRSAAAATGAGDAGWRVPAMAFGPGGRQMVIAVENTLELWDLSSAEHVRTLQGHAGPVLAVRFSPDGGRLASSDGRAVRLWA